MLLENKTVSTPEQAKKHIAEIRRKLNLGRTDELPDETFPKDSSDAISA
jgi:hypothetical protein